MSLPDEPVPQTGADGMEHPEQGPGAAAGADQPMADAGDPVADAAANASTDHEMQEQPAAAGEPVAATEGGEPAPEAATAPREDEQEEAPAAATEEPAPAAEEQQPAAEAAEGAEEVKQEEDVKQEEMVKQEVKEEKAEGPTEEALVARLKELLQEADLTTMTERGLRRSLEAEFGVELTDKKQLIRGEIEKFLKEQDEAEESGEEEEEEEEARPAKRQRAGSGSGFGSRLSPELSAFLGMESCPRTQVVKLLWDYIREHQLQDPKDKRRILLDEKLSTIFPGKSVTMFTMNKHLSKHCKTEDRQPQSPSSESEGDEGDEASSEGEGEDDSEEEAPKPKSAARKRAAPKPRGGGGKKAAGGGSGGKKLTGFTKPVRVSEAMAAWCGKSEISRPELTKFMYQYVKDNNLHDPSNKQFVLADETLKHLTGEARFRAFGFQSLVKQHFLKD